MTLPTSQLFYASKKTKVLDPAKSYKFSDYGTIPLQDVLHDLGYKTKIPWCRTYLPCPVKSRISDLVLLKHQLERNRKRGTFNSEISRREGLIAPILYQLVEEFSPTTKLQTEYPIRVNQWLQGTLDYYIEHNNNFLIIEAKQEKCWKMTGQLAAQLIALDIKQETRVSPQQQRYIYGAITAGNGWWFTRLDRIERDFAVEGPLRRDDSLDIIFQGMVGILQGLDWTFLDEDDFPNLDWDNWSDFD
jgi:hypothetical protein